MIRTRSAADVRWQDNAKCGGAEIDFTPNSEDEATLEAIRGTYCNGCPVWVECLEYALLYRAQGYWGGTSTQDRVLLSYPRNRTKCPVCKCKSLVIWDVHEICQACGLSWTRTSPEGKNT